MPFLSPKHFCHPNLSCMLKQFRTLIWTAAQLTRQAHMVTFCFEDRGQETWKSISPAMCCAVTALSSRALKGQRRPFVPINLLCVSVFMINRVFQSLRLIPRSSCAHTFLFSFKISQVGPLERTHEQLSMEEVSLRKEDTSGFQG